MEINEVLNVIVDFVCLLFLVAVRSERLKQYRMFVMGLFALITSHILSIIEGFILPNLLNVLEHLTLLTTVTLFMLGIYYYFIRQAAKR